MSLINALGRKFLPQSIKDWDLLHQRHFCVVLQDYCALQELVTKMNFTLAVTPPFVHPMMSLTATPTDSVRKYGFFSERIWQRQVAKYSHFLVTEPRAF